jgi:hypothetical protein
MAQDELMTAMRKSTAILVLLLSALSLCHAQDEGRRSEGTSAGSFSLLREKKAVRTPEATFHYTGVTGAVRFGQSLVTRDSMTEQELQPIKGDLDIMEFFALLYQDMILFRARRDIPLEQFYTARFQDAYTAAHRTGDYTRYPLPAEPFDITKVAFTTEERFCGASAGLFVNQPFGDQGRLLFPTGGVTAEFETGKGKNAFLAEFSYGMGLRKLQWYALSRRPVPYLSAFAYYRRELFRSGKWQLSLYGGAGWSSRRFDHLYRNPVAVGGPALSEGVCADIHIRRDYYFSCSHPHRTDTFLRLKLSSSQTYNTAQGSVIPAVGLSAGVHFRNNNIYRR